MLCWGMRQTAWLVIVIIPVSGSVVKVNAKAGKKGKFQII